ncbi:MAG: preprotein translocase subunit SecA [Acidimicrobiia bacterium]|nr:preprotein translocase subunit SecA [Acidimicrobiia bacterium]
MGLFDRILRTGEGKMLRSLQALVPDINAREADYQRLSDDELKHQTVQFRERLDRGADLDDLLIEAFGVVREASNRVIGQRHFDVQLMGGAALHFGWVAEMKTGEGKTLVSTLPVYLNGLSRRGLHVVTVNEYLARRDSEWMGQIHNWLGLTVGLIVPGNDDAAHKRSQYACDLTYGTNNELGFDYLRDNMAMSRSDQVQRGHVYAIIDEIDSILIDEARTPLIISGRVSDAAQFYQRFAQIVQRMRRDEHYEVDEEKRQVAVLEPGIELVEAELGVENLYDVVQTNLVHHLNVGIKAKELYTKDKDYIVENGDVKIVDEFTGRTLEGRRWSEGIHQAVEAKERVRVKEENQTLATVTLQNYFRMYEKLSGMTGTAQTEASELAGTYGLQVVPIPTHKPMVRADQNDLIYKVESGKFDSVIEDIVGRYEIGQPVLAGTASVEHSERLSKLLTRRGVRHEVLNAKQHARESEIIAQAGRLGAVTVATNMAGRGVDILLGGNAELLALRDARAEGIRAATTDEMRRRVIDLEGRIERERADEASDPARLEALEEELAEAIQNRDRFEELHLRWEPECRAEGEKVRQLGGLYVIATERHESRRIDNQLRGRSGRQGDPGESRFYISLEDELMRLFASGVMERVMGAAFPDDVPIESRMVSKAVERAQTTVEQRNGEIRKNVLKYDEVMNEQRKVVYGLRQQVLEQGNLHDRVLEWLADVVNDAIERACASSAPDEWDLQGLRTETATVFPTELDVDALGEANSTDELYELVMGEATAYYEEREAKLGAELMREMERRVLLTVVDQHWREHLYEMDYLREGINLRAMGQRDPLTEWQREGFEMFSDIMNNVRRDFVRYVLHVDVKVAEPQPAPAPGPANVNYTSPDTVETSGTAAITAAARPEAKLSTAVATAQKLSGPPQQPQAQQPVVRAEADKVGRNDPCPCGSGRKYKQCHGRGTTTV